MTHDSRAARVIAHDSWVMSDKLSVMSHERWLSWRMCSWLVCSWLICSCGMMCIHLTHSRCVYNVHTCDAFILFIWGGYGQLNRLIIGLFSRKSSLLLGSFARETCNFIEFTNQSHPIGRHETHSRCVYDVHTCHAFIHVICIHETHLYMWNVHMWLIRICDMMCVHVTRLLMCNVYMRLIRICEMYTCESFLFVIWCVYMWLICLSAIHTCGSFKS